MSHEVTGSTPSPTCPNGHPVNEGALFCDQCGISLIKPIASIGASEGDWFKPEPASPLQSHPPVSGRSADFPPGAAPPPPPPPSSGVGPTSPRKSWYKRTVTIVALVCIIVIGAVVGFIATRKSTPTSSAASHQATSSSGSASPHLTSHQTASYNAGFQYGQQHNSQGNAVALCANESMGPNDTGNGWDTTQWTNGCVAGS